MAPARRAFSVAVYARKGNRVVVIEHKRLKTWLPIGGELEPGETPAEAAVRELVEKLNRVRFFHARKKRPGLMSRPWSPGLSPSPR